MTRTANTFRKGFFIGCLGALALVPALQAQTKEPPADRPHRMGMMANCQMMMADMKASGEKLDDLVAKMNAATGQAKIDQVAALLTELVAQKKVMHAHMMSMDHAAGPGDAREAQPQDHEKHH